MRVCVSLCLRCVGVDVWVYVSVNYMIVLFVSVIARVVCVLCNCACAFA